MGAVYRLDGDSAGAVKAVADLQKALANADKGAVSTTKAAKALNLEAMRIKEAVDPVSRYDRKMQELAQHVKAGRLEVGDAERAAAKYHRELDGVGKAGESAFGAAILGKIGSVAAGMASVGTVVQEVTKYFGDLETRAQTAADRVYNAIGAAGELQQLDTAEGKRALRYSRELIASGAINPDNFAQAYQTGSNLVNAGLSEDEARFLIDRVAGTKLVAPENLNRIGGDLAKLKGTFGEGDLESVTGRVKFAANKTQADLGTSANELLKFAPLAGKVGFSLDESLAAFIVAEGGAASPAAAAEYLKSFTSQVNSRGLAAGDLQGTLANIASRIKPGAASNSVLGDANASIGYDLLQGNIGRLTELEGQIGGARFDVGGVVQGDPALRAAFLRSRAGGRLAAADEGQSTIENLLEAYRAEMNAFDGGRGFGAWHRNRSLDWADEANEEALQLGREMTVSKGKISDELQQAILEELQAINQNTKGAKRRASTREE